MHSLTRAGHFTFHVFRYDYTNILRRMDHTDTAGGYLSGSALPSCLDIPYCNAFPTYTNLCRRFVRSPDVY